MKTILLFLLITVSASAADFKYKLSENQKLEGTFSGDLDKKESVHFLIAKNKDTKKFDLLSFFMDASGNVKQMETLHFKKEPSILSYHKKGTTLTVLDYSNEVLRIIDFDTESLKAVSKEINDFAEPKNIFRLKDKTVIIQHKGAKGELRINEISTTGGITTKNIDVAQDKLKPFFKEAPEAVNTNEFVKNGSISESKAYFMNNTLVITNDDRKEGTTKSMIIDAATGETTFKNYANKTEKQKDVTSYVSGSNLFSIGLNKEDMRLKSFDLATGQEKTSYSLSGELGNNAKVNDAKAMFLKQASKSSMAPTVTVNKAGKNYAVRIDAVNRETYNYNYNWWHMHWMMQQQHWMMHQQMMQHNMRVMQMQMRGPSHCYYDGLISDYVENKDISFTILLDDNLQLTNNAYITTDLADIDKDSHLDQYKDNKHIVQFTATFLDTEMRYIYQDKKTKEIIISSKSL